MYTIKERLELISKNKITDAVKIHFLSSELELTNDLNQLKNDLKNIKGKFVLKKKDFSILLNIEGQVIICLEVKLSYQTSIYDLR